MKKQISSYMKLLVAILGVLLTAGCYNQEPREEILKVYNWADYIDEQVLEDFPKWYQQQTGRKVRVIYQTFDINEVMLTKIERGHEDFDVVCPSEYIIERMLKKDLLLPIDTNFAGKNYLNNQSPYIREQLDELSTPDKRASRYAVGYMWGTAGILYNRKYVTREEASTWESLWDKKFRGKLLMKDSYRDAYGTALIYAHRKELLEGKIHVRDLMNNYSPQAIAVVEKYLKAMKPNIAGWEADFGKEMMTKNKAYLNMTWSGDAVWAIEEAKAVGVQLGYEVPKEGSNVWYDGWVIPKYAGNPEAARYFINYLCIPQVAIANMEATGYVSAIATPEVLEAQTDPEIRETSNLAYFFGPAARQVHINPIQYPDSSVVARCAMIHDSGAHTEAVLEMWSHVKGDNLGGGVVIIILATVGAFVIYAVSRRIKRYRHSQHNRKRRRRIKRK